MLSWFLPHLPVFLQASALDKCSLASVTDITNAITIVQTLPNFRAVCKRVIQHNRWGEIGYMTPYWYSYTSWIMFACACVRVTMSAWPPRYSSAITTRIAADALDVSKFQFAFTWPLNTVTATMFTATITSMHMQWLQSKYFLTAPAACRRKSSWWNNQTDHSVGSCVHHWRFVRVPHSVTMNSYWLAVDILGFVFVHACRLCYLSS